MLLSRSTYYRFMLGCCLLLQIAVTGTLYAQTDGGTAEQSEVVNVRPLDKKTWQEESKDMSFIEKPKEKPKEKKPREIDLNLKPISSVPSGLSYLLYAIVIVGLLALLVYMIMNGNFKANSKVKGKPIITIENLEDNLQDADVDPFLQDALASGNYRMALRLKFLKLMQTLNKHGKIAWRKDKTNLHYLSEMSAQANWEQFRFLVYAYERVWFGHSAFTQDDYKQLAPKFDSYK